MRRTIAGVVVTGCLVAAPTTASAATWYVDQSVEQSGDGRSWPRAFNTMQEALEHEELSAGDDIRVARGVYRPAAIGEGDRCAAFRVDVAVRIRGGFAPGGGPRDPERFPSVLTGELGDPERRDDNSAHVVVIRGTPERPLVGVQLDGFTITRGFAGWTAGDCLGGANDERGGAIFVEHASPVIRRCVVTSNDAGEEGAGIFARDGSIAVVQCTFTHNTVPSSVFGAVGGALSHAGGTREANTIAVFNCTFTDNEAQEGGAVSIVQSMLGGGDLGLTVVNSRFLRNTASVALLGCGGAVRATNGQQVIVNSTFTENVAAFGSAVFVGDGTVSNAILWSNPGEDVAGSVRIVHSLVEGGWRDGGADIIDADPRFRDAGHDDLRLEPSSPAVDTGDGAAVGAVADPFDLDGDGDLAEAAPDLDLVARIVDRGRQRVDLGAYEYLCVGDVDRDGWVDGADTLGILMGWGSCDGCPADVSEDGRVDFFDILIVLDHVGACPGVSGD